MWKGWEIWDSSKSSRKNTSLFISPEPTVLNLVQQHISEKGLTLKVIVIRLIGNQSLVCPIQDISEDGCFVEKLWFHRGVCFPDVSCSSSTAVPLPLLSHLSRLSFRPISLPPSPLSPTDGDNYEWNVINMNQDRLTSSTRWLMNYLNEGIVKTVLDSDKYRVSALVHTLHQGRVLWYKQLLNVGGFGGGGGVCVFALFVWMTLRSSFMISSPSWPWCLVHTGQVLFQTPPCYKVPPPFVIML